ncbi:hypothetical protein [Candidatus Deianiraea vastatrix]|uniref:Uncharacterized protein n=1 Tax=Candidatus Deianiraea vastatrix TaxID=2163644 RepID=A0A5B8XCJ3_9RICK|nr:hypothetical protein [Candidatus Deianiraea vastatrix]QED23062.1 hypothetical protein Deia_00254 [Candidatus Deianiraea vastatrix]
MQKTKSNLQNSKYSNPKFNAKQGEQNGLNQEEILKKMVKDAQNMEASYITPQAVTQESGSQERYNIQERTPYQNQAQEGYLNRVVPDITISNFKQVLFFLTVFFSQIHGVGAQYYEIQNLVKKIAQTDPSLAQSFASCTNVLFSNIAHVETELNIAKLCSFDQVRTTIEKIKALDKDLMVTILNDKPRDGDQIFAAGMSAVDEETGNPIIFINREVAMERNLFDQDNYNDANDVYLHELIHILQRILGCENPFQNKECNVPATVNEDQIETCLSSLSNHYQVIINGQVQRYNQRDGTKGVIEKETHTCQALYHIYYNEGKNIPKECTSFCRVSPKIGKGLREIEKQNTKLKINTGTAYEEAVRREKRLQSANSEKSLKQEAQRPQTAPSGVRADL